MSCLLCESVVSYGMEYQSWDNGPRPPIAGLDLIGPYVEVGIGRGPENGIGCSFPIETNYVNPCPDCGNEKDCANWASWNTVFGPVCDTHHEIIQRWLFNILRTRDAWWAEYIEDAEEPEGTLRSVS